MNKKLWIGLLLVLVLLGSKCEPQNKDGNPTFCLFAGAAEVTDPRAACSATRPSIPDGSAFTLVHTLHEDIETDSPVRFVLETPCGEWTEERKHVDGVLIATLVAPPGSSCALSVVATIENSVLRQHAKSIECTNIKKECEAASDAGTDEDAGD